MGNFADAIATSMSAILSKPSKQKASTLLWPKLFSSRPNANPSGTDLQTWLKIFHQTRMANNNDENQLLNILKLKENILPNHFRKLITHSENLTDALTIIKSQYASTASEKHLFKRKIFDRSPLPADASHADRIRIMTQMEQSIISFRANFGEDEQLSDLDSSELLRCLLVLSSQGETALKWPSLVQLWTDLKQQNGVTFLSSLGAYLSTQKSLYAEVEAAQKLLPKAENSRPQWYTQVSDGNIKKYPNFPKIIYIGEGGTGNIPGFCIICQNKTATHKSHFCVNLQGIREKKVKLPLGACHLCLK